MALMHFFLVKLMSVVKSLYRGLLIVTTLLVFCFALEIVHECGHVIGALGRVDAIHIPLIGISSTSYTSGNPSMVAIASGPILGALMSPCLLLLSWATWGQVRLVFLRVLPDC
jgi:hypothetical protein